MTSLQLCSTQMMREAYHYYCLSEMIWYFVIILSFLVIYVYHRLGQKLGVPQGLKEIPIEKGLAIIGVVNKIDGPLCNYLWKLVQKHGPIYRIRMGMRDIVILNSFEYIKAAMVDNGHALSGRWKSLRYTFVTNNSGILFIDGNNWSQQKSFVLRTLKDFGFGRSRSLEIVQEECLRMLEELDHLKGKSFNFAHFIPIFTANVILKFVMNKRFTHGDPDYKIMEKYMKVTSTTYDPVSNFLMMFPFIENNEWLVRFIIWVTSRKSVVDDCHDVFQKEVKAHLSNIDFHSDGDNLMDRFLIKQRQMKENNGNVESFTDWQMVKNGLELLTSGYDTITSLLVWTCMLMAKYPQVQDKVHEEIIEKIGNERLPTMSDKASLEYSQAVLDEALRVSTIAPLAIPHRTLDHVNIRGYFIPKDTVVIQNLLACHLDKNLWEKPLEFYPEHFLSPDSNGVMKYKPREELIPFGMGKRQCLAESLAKMEYFIFVTSILQRFQVRLVDEKGDFDLFRASGGLIRTLDLQDFVFTNRLKI